MTDLDPDDALAYLLGTRQLLGDCDGAPITAPERIGDRYARAPSLAQRRFDRVAREAMRAAAAGMSALMARSPATRAPAAALLARTIDGEIGTLLRLVR